MMDSSVHANLMQIFEFLKSNYEVASALTAILSSGIAFLAFVISVVSVVVAYMTLKRQTRHNVLSLRPLPEIAYVDYEDRLWVKIRNNGSGPLIVRSLSVTDGATACKKIIDCMPDLPRGYWNHFSGDISGRSMLAGAEICLLKLEQDDGEKAFARSRDKARDALKRLVVTVDYTDVYETNFSPYVMKLDWFGRNLPHVS